MAQKKKILVARFGVCCTLDLMELWVNCVSKFRRKNMYLEIDKIYNFQEFFQEFFSGHIDHLFFYVRGLLSSMGRWRGATKRRTFIFYSFPEEMLASLSYLSLYVISIYILNE